MQTCWLRFRSALLAASAVAAVAGAPVARAQSPREWADSRTMMVETAIASAGVKNPAVLAVMRIEPRHEFVPEDVRPYAYYDMALPIGEGETISPPYVVAYMTDQLDVQPSDRVLEIGTGSGYQAAILSRLAKEVYTIEIQPRLAERAAQTFGRLGYANIQSRVGDGFQGWAEHAPFDKIIVTCSPESVPAPLVDQLREGGRIVIPLGGRYQQTLFSMTKQSGKLKVVSRQPTFFVAMTGRAEALRTNATEGPLTPLVNGGFEQLLASNQPAGWYYLRQARVTAADSRTGGKQCLTFQNLVPGYPAQVLQAIGVDGRVVRELVVELWAKGDDIAPGRAAHEQAALAISYFDEDRASAGQQVLGPWSGSFDWTRKEARLKVPSEARVGVVSLGLLGATGKLSCDDVSVRQVSTPSIGGKARTATK